MKTQLTNPTHSGSVAPLRSRRAAHFLAPCLVVGIVGLSACSGGSENITVSGPTSTSTGDPTNSLPSATTAESPDAGSDEAAIAATTALFASIDPQGPGCSVAVHRDGRTVFANGYGLSDVDRRTPINAETRFDIASVGKQFTGTLILLLAEEGVLLLDDPVSTWLPQLPSWADTMTVEQLMHHTAGLPDYGELLLADGFTFDSVTTNDDVIATLQELPAPVTEPGATYLYSNTDYVLLAEIAAAATGETFAALLQNRIFEPAQADMILDPTHTAPGIAVAYYRQNDDQPWAPIASGWAQVGDGSITTTPEQLARWSSQYWSPTIGGPTINDERIANAAETGLPLFGGLQYGAGVLTGHLDSGEMFIGHEGQWGAFSTSWGVVPDARLAVAVSCNVTGLVPSELPAADLLGIWLAGQSGLGNAIVTVAGPG